MSDLDLTELRRLWEGAQTIRAYGKDYYIINKAAKDFLNKAHAAFPRLLEIAERECEWTFDELGVWNTQCGEAWEFVADGIEENNVKFCPYCGGKVTEAQPKEEG